MADDLEIAAAIEAAYLAELSPHGRGLARSGQGSAEEIYAAERARAERQAAILRQASTPVFEPGWYFPTLG
jgi:hypothetical protein